MSEGAYDEERILFQQIWRKAPGIPSKAELIIENSQ